MRESELGFPVFSAMMVGEVCFGCVGIEDGSGEGEEVGEG